MVFRILLCAFVLTLMACENPAPDETAGKQADASALRFQLARGSNTPLTLIDDERVPSNVPVTLEVVDPPTHGVLRKGKSTRHLDYQHGGATTFPDQFTYRWRTDGDWQTVSVDLNFRSVRAAVRITQPSYGETLSPGTVHVHYTLEGSDFDHLHIALDGQGHNTIRDLTGHFDLEDVTVGRHVISAQLVNANHNPITGENTHDEVQITVE